jgi:hypothetical protein
MSAWIRSVTGRAYQPSLAPQEEAEAAESWHVVRWRAFTQPIASYGPASHFEPLNAK